MKSATRPSVDIDRELNVEELRGRFLRYSRQAYRLLPPLDQPRILDIGCGQGQQTIELARLSSGEVIGIDIDLAALAGLRQRIERAGLGDRITAVHASLFDNGFDDESFDLLWEEGVLHLLDPSRSLPECRRLLKPDRCLVMLETIEWFEGIRDRLPRLGLVLVNQHLMPKHCWWTDYGAPLKERILQLRATYGNAASSPKLARHERDVAAIEKDLDRTDCGLYIVQKREHVEPVS
jgi:SAM-dependent methyltransferase